MSTNSFQPIRKGVKKSIKSHKGLMSVHAMSTAMTTNTSQAYIKATCQIAQESDTQKQVSDVGEPYSDFEHVM
jgi:hypothetical protein